MCNDVRLCLPHSLLSWSFEGHLLTMPLRVSSTINTVASTSPPMLRTSSANARSTRETIGYGASEARSGIPTATMLLSVMRTVIVDTSARNTLLLRPVVLLLGCARGFLGSSFTTDIAYISVSIARSPPGSRSIHLEKCSPLIVNSIKQVPSLDRRNIIYDRNDISIMTSH